MPAEDQFYRQIVEASADGLWLVDPRGRTLFANDRVAALLGRSESEVALLHVSDVLDEPERLSFEARLVARRGGADHDLEALDAVDVERIYRRPDGSAASLMVSERPLFDQEGVLIGHLHRLVDDTRRQALLAEVRRGQSQLADAQSIAQLGSWEVRPEPREVSWSRGMYDVLGVDPATFVPGPEEFVAMLLEADRQAADDNWRRILEESGEHAVDVRVRRADGEVRWLRAVGQILERDAAGEPLRFGGTVQDIHELKQAELTLLDAVEVNTLMQFIATAANEATTFDEALASTRRLLLAHPDWERGVAFDVVDGSLEFRPVGGAFTPTDFERAVAARALAVRGTVLEEDWQPDHPMIGFPVVLENEVVTVLVVTARSPFERHEMMKSLAGQVGGQLAQVAARERTATDLAEARDLAMAASQAKSDFLAMMSHEIRTPLNGVIGLNDLLLHTRLDERQRELADAMQGAGRALMLLISDILDFSKIEAGGLELEAVEFRPAVVLEGVRDLFAADALSRGIALDVEIDDSVPRHLRGDPSRFGQILTNLVSNAVKFTHEGRVGVAVSASTSGRTVTMRVQVSDTGIGLDAEQRDRIFQPFRQADVSTNRTFGGTGLGLAIAQRLARALGGEIGVQSRPGVGSMFWFTCEFELPAEGIRPVVRTASPLGAASGHVLVVEDNQVNQLVAVGMLRVLGYTSEVADDGAAAAARVAAGNFDAVLMDLQMPRLDGFAATRLIRQSEPPGVRVPIIALTASATAGEEERCRAAGMTGFLTKPVRVDELGPVLAAQIGWRAGDVPAPVRVLAERPAIAGAATLDRARLTELVEMGVDAIPLVRRAIDNFVGGAAEQLAELQRYWRQRDASALRMASHKLKGSAANLGAVRVAEAALAVEQLAGEGVVTGVGPKLVDLAAELDEAIAALAEFELPQVEDSSQSA